MRNRAASFAVVSIALLCAYPFAPPLAAEELAAADEKIDEIDQRLKVLERKEEIEEEKESELAKQVARVGTGKEGMSISTPDGYFVLRVRGYVQVDANFFSDDEANAATDSIYLRRARPVFEGTVGKLFDYKIMPDFGQGKTVLYDAYVDLRFHHLTRLRVGKFKPPVGLERLQSATDTMFITRAAPTALVPNRDVGLQLHGEPKSGLLTYALMFSDGAPDGANIDGDTNDGKDLAARVFALPFKAEGPAALAGLGIGLAATRGDNVGTPAAPGLSSYKTPGDLTFFSYRTDSPATAAGTVVADGTRWRFAPQAYWYFARVGVLAEYVESSQEILLGTARETIDNTAGQVSLSVLLSDDSASFKGVSPKKPYEATKPGKGAVELVARVSTLDVDDDAFPVFADPARSASGSDEWAFGVNWYLTRNVRLALNYNETRFEGGAAGSADRATEKVVFTRFQLSF